MAEDDLVKRLKSGVHYTVGQMCQEVGEEKEVTFSKQAIAAISEITSRQCETFAKDLELFARHAKRSTITMDDVKLLSRRSPSLHTHITDLSEEIASSNQEHKEKKKQKKSASGGKGQRRSEGDITAPDDEDSHME